MYEQESYWLKLGSLMAVVGGFLALYVSVAYMGLCALGPVQ